MSSCLVRAGADYVLRRAQDAISTSTEWDSNRIELPLQLFCNWLRCASQRLKTNEAYGSGLVYDLHRLIYFSILGAFLDSHRQCGGFLWAPQSGLLIVQSYRAMYSIARCRHIFSQKTKNKLRSGSMSSVPCPYRGSLPHPDP